MSKSTRSKFHLIVSGIAIAVILTVVGFITVLALQTGVSTGKPSTPGTIVTDEITVIKTEWIRKNLEITIAPNQYTEPNAKYEIELVSTSTRQSYGRNTYQWGNITEHKLNNPDYYITRSFQIGEENIEYRKPIVGRKTSDTLTAGKYTLNITKVSSHDK